MIWVIAHAFGTVVGDGLIVLRTLYRPYTLGVSHTCRRGVRIGEVDVSFLALLGGKFIILQSGHERN